MLHYSKRMAYVVLLALIFAQIGCAALRGEPETRAEDDLITSRITAELARDPDTKTAQIQVETRRGVVELDGFVDNQRAIIRAEQIANRIEGVRRVQNNLILR